MVGYGMEWPPKFLAKMEGAFADIDAGKFQVFDSMEE
jgi:hypothetical protein